jgi:predicted ATPase
MIRKVVVRNYRKFRNLTVDLTPGTNILVGGNDSGKSTLIEAINLALTGRVNGRAFAQELSPYYVNQAATTEYIDDLKASRTAVPPEILIEVYLEDGGDANLLQGTNNTLNEDTCGVRIWARFDAARFDKEYKAFVAQPNDVTLVPTEYYKVEWLGFSGSGVTARSIPATASMVDPSAVRLQAGVDYHLQQIIQTHLAPNERVELARQYRSLRQAFGEQPSVKDINDKLKTSGQSLTTRALSLAIDISQRTTWENTVTAHLDDVPLPFASKGEQSALKTVLAVGRKADGAHVVLIEEPEAHLSFDHLHMLLERIEQQCEGKQIVVATHSNFVLNKLGLENLILLGEDDSAVRLSQVPDETVRFFKKLAGYDTLRLVLAKAVILVEGPSDELVVQRGYIDSKGNLPIRDGIDVISVGLSHKRFLDLAVPLKRRVWVVTDNDGKSKGEIEARFSAYSGNAFVSIHTGSDPNLKTLEPCIVATNDLEVLNTVLGAQHDSKDAVRDWMLEHKTEAALAIFESATKITMPEYIANVFKSA